MNNTKGKHSLLERNCFLADPYPYFSETAQRLGRSSTASRNPMSTGQVSYFSPSRVFWFIYPTVHREWPGSTVTNTRGWQAGKDDKRSAGEGAGGREERMAGGRTIRREGEGAERRSNKREFMWWMANCSRFSEVMNVKSYSL